MKAFVLAVIFSLCAFPSGAIGQSTPSIWGQVVKTNKEIHGHEYFVTFKENGQSYAYPLSRDSKVGEKKISSMVGQYAKIKGRADFEKADVGESKYIMAFQVEEINPLTFKDLNENMPDYSNRLTVQRYVGEWEDKSSVPKARISDKIANTAIFIGGAALAADVLANLVSGSN